LAGLWNWMSDFLPSLQPECRVWEAVSR